MQFTHFSGNLNLNCLIHEAQNVTQNYWPAWACIEGSEDPVKDAAKCCTNAGISWLHVHACATGDLGKYLVNAAADATVDGEPLAEGDLPNFVSIVCNKYQGSIKPNICNAY